MFYTCEFCILWFRFYHSNKVKTIFSAELIAFCVFEWMWEHFALLWHNSEQKYLMYEGFYCFWNFITTMHFAYVLVVYGKKFYRLRIHRAIYLGRKFSLFAQYMQKYVFVFFSKTIYYLFFICFIVTTNALNHQQRSLKPTCGTMRLKNILFPFFVCSACRFVRII